MFVQKCVNRIHVTRIFYLFPVFCAFCFTFNSNVHVNGVATHNFGIF